ncbi:C4-dicarboxylate ABC transporter permease [Salinivibrio kushneri]|jgi:TRAP transporter, DctM subunit|uniref:TRAP transporter large permease protein n=1 Tax=Salinivibrio kushneri TaxID=1908198 RepID=A0AB36JZH6_9GAMM|nr:MULTISPECIES: TRAP transporter large permease subunit [Salinivibrio]MPX96724.1 TRAP transporter large permease subunit [Salinivibrio sp. VYel6]OOE40035.1 C4-dicarboxylate ABC transporter permease [Salinivibrio kushneri]OOE68112.1 C4-dicarboxylate ABC transporter permease [Salinivibrio sp. IB868]OOE74287.1 C4-dicarboxylate ABC transporter permease [Salinivibrio sp. ML290]OOE74785.1 C4-dicarboxylate ABC transporter permease [Salinivibrio sp. IB870]
MFDLSSIGLAWGSLLMLVMLIGLLLTGMQLAFVSGFVAIFFTLFWFGPEAMPLIASRTYSFASGYVFLAVPMFVLMAALLDRSGIAKDLFDAMKSLGRKVRGGVAVQTILVAVLLASMSGVIGGETVLLGILALPQMLRLGYDRKLAIGTTCAGGALGTMLPPSIVLIIYGMTASVSIGDLFKASFLPAFILAACYIAYVLIRCKLNPSLAPIPSDSGEEEEPQVSYFKALFFPLFSVAVVLGSIYTGVASVTEASALGVVGIMLSAIVRGEMNLSMLKESAIATMRTCGMIMWIGIGASALVGIYNLMGGIDFVEQVILSLSGGSAIGTLLIMMVILLVLGMFLDWVGVALLTMPIFVPIITGLGFDPIWFGVVFCLNMQVSFLSPPFGPAAFYLKSVAPKDISLGEIFTSLLPFIALQVFVLSLVIIFPELAMWWQ